MENVLLQQWLMRYEGESYNGMVRDDEYYARTGRFRVRDELDMTKQHNARAETLADRALSRHKLVQKYAFSVPTDEALDVLCSFSPLIEVCAGTGYWAKLLHDRGADVLAFDNALPGDSRNHWYHRAEAFFPVVEMDAVEAVTRYSVGRTLVLMWPPYRDSIGTDTVKAYGAAGGQRVVYVGEGEGGCCGDDDLFMLFGDTCYRAEWDDEHDCAAHSHAEWRKVREIALPQWEGIHDDLCVYEREASE